MNNDNNKRKQYFLNKEQLISLLVDEKWNEVYTEQNVNVATKSFVNTLKKYIGQCTQTKTLRRSEVKRNSWITTGLIKSINRKNELYKKLQKNPDNHILKHEFKTCRDVPK